MIKTLRVLAVALIAASPALAEDATSFTLENGLQVVVIEDHRAPVVTHMVWYQVGSADEAPGVSGLAHFVEHLMFMSTDTLASGAIDEIVGAQGGELNAQTSWDYTTYHERVAADRLGLMMQLEADRMRNLRVTEAEVATERNVILEERNESTDDDPVALFWEQILAAQFMNHPYGVPVLGWRHEMESLSRDDALGLYRSRYAPNNAILIVAGDVTPDAVRGLAEEHYGPLAPNPGLAPRVRPVEPPQLAERRIRMEDPRVGEPLLIRTYLAPERDAGSQERAAALTVLAELLGGGGNASILAKALMFEQATATSVGAFYDPTEMDQTTFALELVPVEGVSLDAAEAAMDEALARFMAEGIDPAAFARVKTRLRANDIFARDDSNGLAWTYGEALTSGLTLDDIVAWPAVLESVTPEAVIAAAGEVLDRRRAVTGHLVQAQENGL